jgi:hypothetical protein
MQHKLLEAFSDPKTLSAKIARQKQLHGLSFYLAERTDAAITLITVQKKWFGDTPPDKHLVKLLTKRTFKPHTDLGLNVLVVFLAENEPDIDVTEEWLAEMLAQRRPFLEIFKNPGELLAKKEQHKLTHGLIFRLESQTETTLKILVKQDKNHGTPLLDKATLIDLTKTTFTPHTDLQIEVHVYLHPQGPPDMVNHAWFKTMMQEHQVTIPQIAKDLTLKAQMVTDTVTDPDRTLNNQERAMYYYYFKALELQKQIDAS